ncbi:PucR family transcriptional regulator [Nocardia fluminea]|uniref:PucR family transcriptional regulator n=1 Tax=Nocardia fluminea TaxID=134984 RepID=UPI0014731AD2|nr:helix-turn-helix domain-containing protein [Nocardia fluminea]
MSDQLTRRATSADQQNVLVAGQRIAAVLEAVTTSFTSAYLGVLRSEARVSDEAGEVFASALITGAPESSWRHTSGFVVSEAYAVLALAGAHDPVEDVAGADISSRRWLRRLRVELASFVGGSPPAVLGERGATVLIPAADLADADVVSLFERLQAAVGTPLRAGLARAAVCDVPDATREAYELLDLAERLHRPAGVYRMADLVMEYQITRAEIGRDQLAALLDPLDDQPELVDTLAAYIRHQRNRRRTARTLNVHPNTVDYRLNRVAHHTGLDPTHVNGLWYLQAALVAHAYDIGATDPRTADSDALAGAIERRTGKWTDPAVSRS